MINSPSKIIFFFPSYKFDNVIPHSTLALSKWKLTWFEGKKFFSLKVYEQIYILNEYLNLTLFLLPSMHSYAIFWEISVLISMWLCWFIFPGQWRVLFVLLPLQHLLEFWFPSVAVLSMSLMARDREHFFHIFVDHLYFFLCEVSLHCSGPLL